MSLLLFDIEGTTTPLDFVHKILFPYARTHLSGFVLSHQSEPQVQKIIDDVRQIMFEELGIQASLNETIQQLDFWIQADRKVTPLKTLQGMIWKNGYHSRAFTSPVYEDVITSWKKWKEQGHTLAIYSSGSIEAQKHLFAHTEWGDLTSMLSGFFDTTIGQKNHHVSYEKIKQALPAKDYVFFSDRPEELEAAQEAKFKTWLIMRENQINNSPWTSYKSFTEITFLN